MRRTSLLVCALLVCALLALAAPPAPARADPGHAAGATLVLQPIEIALDLSDPGRVPIDWVLRNEAGHAMTVHGARSMRAERITLMRRRVLLGAESYQRVDFLRVEAGETVELKSPVYVLEIEGLAASGATIFPVTLDLGPDGELSFALIEPLE